MEAIFRALGDPHRRLLLDRLFERDGQTLTELEAALPEMTRFGVMKHLRVLEAAGLVTTQRSGREKLHYLNPAPIRVVLDRWISKYAAPWVEAMTDLKRTLEGDAMPRAKHVYEVYIRTTPQKLWDAMTKPEFTSQYAGGTLESNWKVGETYHYVRHDGAAVGSGKLLEVDPPRRLVHTFDETFGEPSPATDDPATVTWEIAPMGDVCKLTLVYEYDAAAESDPASVAQFRTQGWPMVLSGLKTLLETGERLPLEALPGPSA